jgi:hypothetical protein
MDAVYVRKSSSDDLPDHAYSHLSPSDQPWQDLTPSIHPTPQLMGRCDPVPLVDPAAQGRSLKPTRAKIEREIDDGSQTPV